MRLPKLTFIALLVALLLLTVLPSMAQDDAEEPLLTEEEIAACIPAEGETPPPLLDGARPSSAIIAETTLLSQPPLTPDTVPLEVIDIPEGSRVVVIDLDDQTQSYYRVVWPCGKYNFTGWLPIEDVQHNPRRTNPKPAPPGCAQAVQLVNLLDDVWISDVAGRVAVVVDLYRETTEERYPRSSYYISRDGRALRDRERIFETSGAILINGVVMGVEVRRGSVLGFTIQPEPTEDLNFFGILYNVPDGCQFGE